MTKHLLLFILFLSNINLLHAQYADAFIGFENPELPDTSMDYTQTIDTGNYYIEYYFQSPWGDYNRFYGRKNEDSSYDGFTVSNIKDSITPESINDRAAFPAIGNDGSKQYAIGHGFCTAHVSGLIGMKPTQSTEVFGLYVTNSTIGVLSMEHGDSLAKKFGGATGTDPDWLLLTIKGYVDYFPDSSVGSVQFYLADFRNDTPSMDYIVKDWTWMDLSSLGRVDSLSFTITSSDTNQTGQINTPAYFCIDDLGIEAGGGIDEANPNSFCRIYPNPVQSGDQINFDVHGNIPPRQKCHLTLYNLSGKKVLQQQANLTKGFRIPDLPPGIYTLVMQNKSDMVIYSQKLIVQ